MGGPRADHAERYLATRIEDVRRERLRYHVQVELSNGMQQSRCTQEAVRVCGRLKQRAKYVPLNGQRSAAREVHEMLPPGRQPVAVSCSALARTTLETALQLRAKPVGEGCNGPLGLSVFSRFKERLTRGQVAAERVRKQRQG